MTTTEYAMTAGETLPAYEERLRDLHARDAAAADASRHVRSLPVADRAARVKEPLAAGDRAAPRPAPVWGGRHVRDLTPHERATAYAALGINPHIFNRTS
jgi:hypothetical protein